MILLTRLNGTAFALNPDLVERADCTPDTVITLVDGTKYLVAESLPELVGLIRQYRASVIAEAQLLASAQPAQRLQPGHRIGPDSDPYPPDDCQEQTSDNVVPLYRRER